MQWCITVQWYLVAVAAVHHNLAVVRQLGQQAAGWGWCLCVRACQLLPLLPLGPEAQHPAAQC